MQITELDFRELYYRIDVRNASGADLVFENIRNGEWFPVLDGMGELVLPVGGDVEVYWFRDYPSLLLGREYLTSRARMVKGRVVRTLRRDSWDLDRGGVRNWLLVVFSV